MKGVAGPRDPIYGFDGFLVDPVLVRLTAGGAEVPITRKTFQLLVVLLERHGELVTKDELMNAIWPDTFVEENNLARTVSMLRKALQEHGGDPSVIQTVVGQGYRFVAPVVVGTRERGPDAASSVRGDGGRIRAWTDDARPADRLVAAGRARGPSAVRVRALAGLAAAIVVVALGATTYRVAPVEEDADAAFEPRLWRLTAGGRLEDEPVWAPDGRSFAYSSDRSGNFDIWIQGLDHAEPAQLTSHPARDWQPAWSPDGRTLLFSLTRTGRRQSLRLLDIETGRTVEVLQGDLSRLGRVSANWHPDGRLSVYGRHPTEGWGFWTGSPGDHSLLQRVDVSPDVQRRIDRVNLDIVSFAWAPDGRSLYFAGRTDAAQNLWQVRVDPDTLAWIDGPVRLTTSVALESDPAISPDGRRLLFSSRIDRTQVWALPLDHVAGRIVGPGEPVTPPGVDTDVLDFSADGRLAYSMERGRGHELWVRTADRRDALIRAEAQATILQPRWSPDGSRLVYYSGNPVPRVVLLDAEKGTARPLEAPLEPSNVFAWSPDGSSLIIGCPTADHPHAAICEVPLDADGRAVGSRVLASDRSRNLWQARWAPDGRSLYYLSYRDGFWNLWMQRFDPDRGRAVGPAVQVTDFTSTDRMILHRSQLQTAITDSEFVVPLTESSGAVWALDLEP
jgi:Tol biopolymer transport system component/DNA-binding winged helix-turn-helix (wHTH) protein